MHGKIEVFPSPAALAYGAAELIATTLHAAQLADGIASFALSGGTTPTSVYSLLATPQYRQRLDWSRVHIFWGDERCVPPTSVDSNFRMAQQTLLHAGIVPRQHIHRIHGEFAPGEAAEAYEREIRSVFGVASPAIPLFTLILLGLGEDGHTASLFPGSALLAETQRLAAEAYVEQQHMWRVSMTFPLLNHARAILFLVSGTTKASALRQAVGEEGSDVPARRIVPAAGTMHWYVDRDAASQLHSTETP